MISLEVRSNSGTQEKANNLLATISKRKGRGQNATLPSGGERLAVNRKSLVANRGKAGSGAVCRGHLGGGWVGFQHASLVDAKVARSSRRNTATEDRKSTRLNSS